MWPFIILSILIVSVDRVLKFAIFKNFPIGDSVPLIKNILHITPTYNTGIAFGLFRENSLSVLIGVSSIVSAFILYILLAKRPRCRLLVSGLFLILSGAVGNLIDRAIYGHVLDFIDIRIWPVFNIADSSITIGACLLLWHLFAKKAH